MAQNMPVVAGCLPIIMPNPIDEVESVISKSQNEVVPVYSGIRDVSTKANSKMQVKRKLITKGMFPLARDDSGAMLVACSSHDLISELLEKEFDDAVNQFKRN